MLAGTAKTMLALALPGVAVTLVGTPGGPSGVTFTLLDAGPAPIAFAARTLQAY